MKTFLFSTVLALLSCGAFAQDPRDLVLEPKPVALSEGESSVLQRLIGAGRSEDSLIIEIPGAQYMGVKGLMLFPKIKTASQKHASELIVSLNYRYKAHAAFSLGEFPRATITAILPRNGVSKCFMVSYDRNRNDSNYESHNTSEQKQDHLLYFNGTVVDAQVKFQAMLITPQKNHQLEEKTMMDICRGEKTFDQMPAELKVTPIDLVFYP